MYVCFFFVELLNQKTTLLLFPLICAFNVCLHNYGKLFNFSESFSMFYYTNRTSDKLMPKNPILQNEKLPILFASYCGVYHYVLLFCMCHVLLLFLLNGCNLSINKKEEKKTNQTHVQPCVDGNAMEWEYGNRKNQITIWNACKDAIWRWLEFRSICLALWRKKTVVVSKSNSIQWHRMVKVIVFNQIWTKVRIFCVTSDFGFMSFFFSSFLLSH